MAGVMAAHQRCILSVILVLALVMSSQRHSAPAGVSADEMDFLASAKVPFHNQIPTGADFTPPYTSRLRCEPWQYEGVEYLVCMENSGNDGNYAAYFYDFALNRWTSMVPAPDFIPIPGSRLKPAFTVFAIVEDTLYATRLDVCDRLFTLDLVQGEWNEVTLPAELSEGLCKVEYNNAFAYNGYFYIADRGNGGSCGRNLVKFDVTHDNFTLVPVITTVTGGANAARCNPALAVYKDTVYSYGGAVFATDFYEVSRDLAVLNLTSLEWSPLPSGNIDVVEGSMVISSVNGQDRLLVAGGYTSAAGDTPQTFISQYLLESSTWNDVTVGAGSVFDPLLDDETWEDQGLVYLGMYRNRLSVFMLGVYSIEVTRKRDLETAFTRRQRAIIYSVRDNPPYFSLPVDGVDALLRMDGRNSKGLLLPTVDAEVGLQVGFARLTECDVDGTPLTGGSEASVEFPISAYTIDDHRFAGKQDYYFMVDIPVRESNSTITLKFTLFEKDETITHAGVTFDVPRNTFKSTIQIDHWPFLSTSNTLELQIAIGSSDKGELKSRQVETENDGLVVARYKFPKISSTVRLLKSALVDNVATRVLSTSFADDSCRVLFPSFDEVLVYDPDFGATLDASDDGGDGDDDGNIVYLAFLSVLALVPIVIVLAVIVAVAYFVVKHYFHRGGKDDFAVDDL